MAPAKLAFQKSMNTVSRDYEIRFHRADGKLSLVMFVPALSDADAEHQAKKMLLAGLSNAHIWDEEGRLVHSLYRLQ